MVFAGALSTTLPHQSVVAVGMFVKPGQQRKVFANGMSKGHVHERHEQKGGMARDFDAMLQFIKFVINAVARDPRASPETILEQWLEHKSGRTGSNDLSVGSWSDDDV